MSFCLAHPFTQLAFSTLTLTPFSRLLHHPRHQIRPSSEREERRKGKYTHFHLNIHQQQPHKNSRQKKKTKTKTQKNREKRKHFTAQTDRDKAQSWKHTHRHTLTHARTHARLPDTQLTLTDKHTKKQQTQSPAQPEVYFMQKYSKVCFTIQLNIKGGYIPLWSLTPQWTNPTHPHPLTAYRESWGTSLLITR